MENYIVSARKYRPSTFESVVGQKALTETLRNAIRQNHLAHAYLFCGPRGVGKTTCARIFAKTINCLNPGDNHDACNECESCRAFNEQRSFNIHELDAASNNSVDDIRQLIAEVRIPPQVGKYSVYIIDEVHMLSSGAFNALLKTLEEPPSYAIFILATTEKHKVLPTILSRCQVYDFTRITVADTIAHLKYVASQEGITAEEQALNVVAQKADGGMRDALSIFDQLVAFCGNTVTYQQTLEVLNVLDSDYYFRLINYALAGDVSGALLLLNEVICKGFDAGHFVTGLASHLRDVLVCKDPQTAILLETSDAIRQQYVQQAAQCAAPWIFQALDIMNTCDINYRVAKNKRLLVELALVKLTQIGAEAVRPVAQQPARPVAQQPARPVEPVKVAAPVKPVEPQSVKPVEPAKPATPTVSSIPSIPTIPTIPTVPSAGAIPAIPQIPKAGTEMTSATVSQAVPPTAVPEASPIRNNPFTLDQFEGAWAGLRSLPLFREDSRLMATLIECQPVLQDQTLCVLTVANTFQKKEFSKYGKAVMDHMRDVLKNDGLKMSVVVSEHQKEHVAYTAEEKYKLLASKNPELKRLKDALSLQLE